MPVMDGFEATREIKKEFSQVIIAALTAYASKQFSNRCLNSGMDFYLTKPVREDKLEELIKSAKLIPI